MAFSSQPPRRRLVLMSRRYRQATFSSLAGCSQLSITSRSILADWGKSSCRAGQDAAYTAALNVLAATKEHLGSLDRVTRVVRLGVFIATFGDFFDQPKVADAVWDLFRDVFGIQKTSVRVVIGVPAYPWECRSDSMSSSKSQSSKFFLRRLDVYKHPSQQTNTRMFSLKE